MEALRQMLIRRTGYPRHGALAQAARESGVAQSLLSRYMDANDPLRPEPPQLERLAVYLEVPYNDLLIQVWGRDDSRRPRTRSVTPHERALLTTDALAAAVAELRDALLTMAPASRPHNDRRKDRSRVGITMDYGYQTNMTPFPVSIPRLGGLSDREAA